MRSVPWVAFGFASCVVPRRVACLVPRPARHGTPGRSLAVAVLAACAFACALTVAIAPTVGAQTAKGPDFSGVWVLNLAKSDFSGQPVPRGDTTKIARTGNVYQVDQVGDFGPEHGRVQRISYKWPATDGETTTQLQQGATLHVTVTMKADTATFSNEFAVQGTTMLRQTGRDYLSAGGKVMTRDTVLKPTQGDDQEPVHMTLVYDRK
jgi:hypothetical protein